jgi:23S rRNA pseudouridine2605 synthase
MLERLQKIIARAGVASRRHAEELIASGMVTVNGQTITELGSKADPSQDHIKVSGKLLRAASEHVYLLLNKPPEVVATMSDPEGRRSLRDLLHGVSERVFPVGRLEYHSSGAVFLTNDGDLANRMLRSHRVPQVYHLKLKTLLTFEEIETLARTTHARISRLRGKEMPWYEVTMSESSRDILRSRLFQTGHPVEKIRRVAIANLHLAGLGPGDHRELTSSEISALSRILDGKPEELAKLLPKRRFKPRPASHKKSHGRRESSFNKSSGKSSFKSSFKSSGKSSFKSSGRPDSRTDSRPDSRPSFGSDSHPNSRPNSRPGSRSDSRPSSRSDSRSDFRPGSRSDSKKERTFASRSKRTRKTNFQK